MNEQRTLKFHIESWGCDGLGGSLDHRCQKFHGRTVAKSLSPMAAHVFVSELEAVQLTVQDCHVFVCPWVLGCPE